jgi:hypothetical protein
MIYMFDKHLFAEEKRFRAMAKTSKREVQLDMKDRILLIVLAAVLITASIAVGVQMLRPSGVRENTDAMVQDCLAIISGAQKWHRSSAVVGGAERRSWSELSFDKLGYIDGVGPELRTLINSNGQFTLRIAQDGSSFDLIAESRVGKMIIYKGVSEGVPPDPEIR